MKIIRILGIRGIPAAHGGFETFAEYLALFLVKKGWQVTVYCQDGGNGSSFEDKWRGIRRVHIPVKHEGSRGSIIFDLKSTWHAAGELGTVLTLGYNTALFCFLYRIKGIKNIINMDGIEWKRQKWPKMVRVWFWLNERLGCLLGNHLVADNPGIVDHLVTRVSPKKITMIPYGAELIDRERNEDEDEACLAGYDLASGNFLTVIARPEPENSVLEIVRVFSRKPRNMILVVLGNFDEAIPYQKAIMDSASKEVKFLGAIYNKTTVQTLRYHCAVYIHGHQVGGTNPSLLEALGAGNPILAHDNQFNRWVAGDGACYFKDEEVCAAQLDIILEDLTLRETMRKSSLLRYAEEFTWSQVLTKYEDLLLEW